jgi:diguanylate cyclase (GGDEF)-like protein
LFRLCAALLLLAIASARPALADHQAEDSHPPVCHAVSEAGRTVAAMVKAGPWNCTDTAWQADYPVAWLRFNARHWLDQQAPQYFSTRTARHESITLSAVDADGTIRSRTYAEADARPFEAGPVFQLRLPEITPATTTIIAQIELPHSVPMLAEAQLVHDPQDAAHTQMEMMVMALVVGMLILPLLFDVTFFVVLRERFVLYHAMMVTGMMGYVLFSGGIVAPLFATPVPVIAIMAPLSWAIGCGAALLFLGEFIERGALAPWMRRLLFWSGCWTIAVPGFFALQFDFTQPIDDKAYFYTITPAAAIVTWAIIHALWRGSRSARFVAVAWTPLILTSLERVVRGLGFYAAPSSLDLMMFVATGIEVVVISLAIADRFFALRQERDAALTEARMLEQISTRDALTGLMNRRAIEARFPDLIAQGFDTFALVDLDRFKAINDLHGHQIGDAALVACAEAMRSSGDRDSVAVRLGGEEFVVLLRGERTLDRAEALRQAIPLRIAKQVPGLELPVTASMGVIVLTDANRHKMSFSEFYARADALMYEAKASGRNRLAYERLTVFSPPPKAGRRRAA